MTVSGDGTCKKRRFTSLYGVASLVGYAGKIVDVKSAFWELCQAWEIMKDTAHLINRTGSVGKD